MISDGSISQLELLDLHECAEFIGQCLSNPITIEDVDHKLIAYSTHAAASDPARTETIMGRRVSKTVLNKLWQVGIIPQLMKTRVPVRISPIEEIGLGSRVAIAIRKEQYLLGYIWVQEINQSLGESEILFLQQAAQAIMPKLYQRQTKRRIQTEKSREFFWNLLLDGAASHYEVQARAEELDIILPKPFMIFLFEINHPLTESIQKDLIYLLTHLNHSFALSKFPLWVSNQNQLITIGGGPSTIQALQSQANHFVTDVCQRMQVQHQRLMIVGTSGLSYDSYQQIEQSYRQAQSVLRMKKIFVPEMKDISGYADLGMYRLLPFFWERNEQEGYQNHRLQKLMEYDRENQSFLVETLETFLDHGGKNSLIIEKLHIHPNTLAYRLKRICEIGQIDLGDPNQRFTLYIDLKLQKMSKK